MEAQARLLMEVLERSLRITVHGADVTAIGAGHTTGWRALTGCTTAQLVDLDGRLERADGSVLRLRPGEGFCLPPHARHCSTIVRGSGVSRWSLFTCTVLGSVDAMLLFSLPVVWSGARAERLGELNAHLSAAVRAEPGIAGAVALHAAAVTLVAELVRDAPLAPEASLLLGHAQRLSPVLDHIEAHLERPLTRTGLARIAGCSPSRFAALFRAATGISLTEHLARRRLERAQQLLLAQAQPVQAIAHQVGFGDAFHFSRWFRRRVGLSPIAYRAAGRAQVRWTLGA